MSGLGMPKPKRVGPPTVAPVTLDGVRYEALHWGRERGLGQNGGYVAAFDAASNQELWTARIYAIDYLPKLETDVQDIFIRTLEVGANGQLLVTDERGRRYLLHVGTRMVTPLDRVWPDSPALSENTAMASMPSISRPSLPPIAPIDHDGVRYEQGTHDDRDGDQPGGYLTATDIKTGQRLWRLKVYTVATPEVPGAPVFARYFRTMKLSADGAALEIENEVGAVYRVDLATRVLTQLSGPPETASPKPSIKPKPKPTP